MKFAHINIIAKDWRSLSTFYQEVFGCVPVPPQRDLQGAWIDSLTAIKAAHIQGEHLRLPGYGNDGPTLEIFSYNEYKVNNEKMLDKSGFSHIAFEIEDIKLTLNKLLAKGGSQIGELIKREYPGVGIADLVYCRDIEGNIIELQTWNKETIINSQAGKYKDEHS